MYVFGTDFLEILGLPDNKDMKAVFKHEMNDVPMENVLTWLTEIGRTDLRDRMIKIQEEIEVGLYLYFSDSSIAQMAKKLLITMCIEL